MNLDDISKFKEIDAQGMLSHIEGLPDQLEFAWQLGAKLPLPDWKGINKVLVAGMGGSAIGADLVAAYIAPHCPLPVVIHRNYSLPAWAHGEDTLVIASSHSGNTEETLSSFTAAQEKGCEILALTTGGKLAEMCKTSGIPFWQFEHHGQPRAAVGFSAALLLAVFSRSGWISNPGAEIQNAVRAMRKQQESLHPQVSTVNNPAKRIAGQIYGRWVTVIGADILEPVARRWKSQISEIAKAWGQFESLPEVDHNTLAGLSFPEDSLSHNLALFLRARSYQPRNLLRSKLTKTAFMLEGLGTDFIDAQGDKPLAQQWTALHLGDYTAYYLAMAYGVDPTAIPTIQMLKSEMADKEQ
ncbi:MAG: bifunctional phosphoglucose/phosphomannose isomerase [Chloroflexota bacterium]|nr:MAG: bifunctional phosphoglucose/phosphomannose isomerase [Chloroflexota bacterium]